MIIKSFEINKINLEQNKIILLMVKMKVTKVSVLIT